MNKTDFTLGEMITIAQNRLEGLRNCRTGMVTLPIENGKKLRSVYIVLSEIEDQLTPLNEMDKVVFEEELTKKEN